MVAQKARMLGSTLALILLATNALADRSRSIAFDTIASGGQSGIDHQMSMVVDTPMHWQHLWSMHTKDQLRPEPLPNIDFDNEIVVAQFLGQVASCGYDIYTARVKETDGAIRVKTMVDLPDGPINCLIAEQPFEIIRIARTNTIVLFNLKIDDDD